MDYEALVVTRRSIRGFMKDLVFRELMSEIIVIVKWVLLLMNI